jgi:6-phosphogluconolactonase
LRRVLVYPDTAALAEAAAEHFADWAARSVAAHRRFDVALSGGSTPRPLYEQLAAGPHGAQVPWERLRFFWGDERAVPPDDPASNYRQAHAALLSKVPVPEASIYRMRGEAEDLEAAAADYEREMRLALPRLDLALLGLGPDGHTASLFPGYPALDETTRWVVATAPAPTDPPVRRLTLTLPALNDAAQVLFLVTGTAKAALVREILSGTEESRQYPAGRVRPRRGDLTWMLDEAAASELGEAYH